jgi:hypothetical protein
MGVREFTSRADAPTVAIGSSIGATINVEIPTVNVRSMKASLRPTVSSPVAIDESCAPKKLHRESALVEGESLTRA